jgi:hypothetical protein
MKLPLQENKEEKAVNSTEKKRTSTQGDSKLPARTVSSKSRQRKSGPVMPPSEVVVKSFCPVARQNVKEEKYNMYRGKLYQIMYAELTSALDKMMVICDGK